MAACHPTSLREGLRKLELRRNVTKPIGLKSRVGHSRACPSDNATHSPLNHDKWPDPCVLASLPRAGRCWWVSLSFRFRWPFPCPTSSSFNCLPNIICSSLDPDFRGSKEFVLNGGRTEDFGRTVFKKQAGSSTVQKKKKKEALNWESKAKDHPFFPSLVWRRKQFVQKKNSWTQGRGGPLVTEATHMPTQSRVRHTTSVSGWCAKWRDQRISHF